MSLKSNYVTKQVRLALYKRDNFTCQFCNNPIERDVRQLSLDHLQARSKNGEKSNPKNLVCSCTDCNVKKGNKTLSQFARVLGLHPKQLKRRIKQQVNKPINVKAAKREINTKTYLVAIMTF